MLTHERVREIQDVAGRCQLQSARRIRVRSDEIAKSLAISTANADRGNRHIIGSAHGLNFVYAGVVENHREDSAGASGASDLVGEKANAALNQRAFAVKVLGDFGV